MPIACSDRQKALPHARGRACLWWSKGARNGNYKRGLYTAEGPEQD
jgi:hypothetical protein